LNSLGAGREATARAESSECCGLRGSGGATRPPLMFASRRLRSSRVL